MELLWQTDELRVERLEVINEARNGVHAEGLSSAAVLDVFQELQEQLSSWEVDVRLQLTDARLRSREAHRPGRDLRSHPGDARRA